MYEIIVDELKVIWLCVTLQESSEFLQSPVLPAINVMSSPDRQVATSLGPQVFEGISGGFDTFGKILFLSIS